VRTFYTAQSHSKNTMFSLSDEVIAAHRRVEVVLYKSLLTGSVQNFDDTYGTNCLMILDEVASTRLHHLTAYSDILSGTI
jgi:hypothetical protein